MKREEEPFGVLLMGYGSPSSPADLPGYLSEVLHGRAPGAEMVRDYAARYERIGWSPQNRIIGSLRTRLEQRIARERPGARVFLATKHWHPSLKEVIPQAAEEGFRRLVAVPLSPYASTWILQPYEAGVREGRAASRTPIEIELRAGWHLDPDWIGYWRAAIARELARLDDPKRAVLLSAHSLPARFRDLGDPYPGLVTATAEAIARAARLDRWSFTYQSPGNTTEPWLGPDIVDVMADWQRRGARQQLVASAGFVFDHLETLYDLDVVVREAAAARGIDYRRVPMPNDASEIVEALARRVLA